MIQMSEGFRLWSAVPLDDRLCQASLADMVALDEYKLYDGIICTIKGDEDHKTYQWWSTNSVDPTLKRWREFTGSGGGNSGQTIQVAELPAAAIDLLGTIYQYIGANDADKKLYNGFFYICDIVTDEETGEISYAWKEKKVQAAEQNSEYVLKAELTTHAQSNLHLTQAQREAIHTHENKTEILDKLGQNSDGALTFNNTTVAGSIPISKDTGNILENKEDGLYVTQEITLDPDTTNALESRADGLYCAKSLEIENQQININSLWGK